MNRVSQKTLRIVMMCAVMLGLIATLPVMAQGDGEEEFVVVVGEVVFDRDGNIVVDGYFIAPASGIDPSELALGDGVIITGPLLPDGETILALSIEFFDVAEFTAADEGSDDQSSQGRGRGNNSDELDDDDDNGNGSNGRGRGNKDDDSDDDDDDGNGRGRSDEAKNNNGNNGNSGNNGKGRGNSDDRRQDDDDKTRGNFCEDGAEPHPAAERIAEKYEAATVDAIMGYFCDGNYGLGEIMLAYKAAEGGSVSVGELLFARSEGNGWGNIMRDAGVSPSSLAPGRSRGNGNNKD